MISVSIHSPTVDIGSDWDDLVSRAQPNVFMSPAALKAADATKFAKVQVFLAWDEVAQPRRLVGLWAMQERRSWTFGPAMLDALPFEYAFLSSPVVDPAVAVQVMSKFLAAIADTPALPRAIHMKSLDTEAASYRPLVDALTARGGRMMTAKTINRPVLWRGTDVKASGERRKKLRQAWKRMSSLGETAMEFVTESEAVASAFETFLEIEFRSWKGAAGSALLCRDEDAAFTRRMIVDMATRKQVVVQVLKIDGQTIGTQIALLSGTMAYAWKTTFDHNYAKYSPGTIMTDKLTEHLFATTQIAGIDSCSAEKSLLADLWSDRRVMADVVVNVGPHVSLGFWIEAAHEFGRERLKSARDRVIAARKGGSLRSAGPAVLRSGALDILAVLKRSRASFKAYMAGQPTFAPSSSTTQPDFASSNSAAANRGEG